MFKIILLPFLLFLAACSGGVQQSAGYRSLENKLTSPPWVKGSTSQNGNSLSYFICPKTQCREDKVIVLSTKEVSNNGNLSAEKIFSDFLKPELVKQLMKSILSAQNPNTEIIAMTKITAQPTGYRFTVREVTPLQTRYGVAEMRLIGNKAVIAGGFSTSLSGAQRTFNLIPVTQLFVPLN